MRVNGCASARRVSFTKRSISNVEVHGPTWSGSEANATQTIRVSVVQESAGVIDGEGFAGKRYDRFLEVLTAHQSKLLTDWGVYDLRIVASTLLLDHATERIVGETYGIGEARVDGDRVAVGVPSIVMNIVVRQIAVAIVSGYKVVEKGDAICRC